MWSSGKFEPSTKLKEIKVELIIRLTLLTQDSTWKVMERERAAWLSHRESLEVIIL